MIKLRKLARAENGHLLAKQPLAISDSTNVHGYTKHQRLTELHITEVTANDQTTSEDWIVYCTSH